jgi:hypothetical protein
VTPVHPAVHVLNHPYSRTFALVSVPNAIATAADCAARARGDRFAGEISPEYGQAYGMNFRFQTRGGEAPVMRTLWTNENGSWRIAVYDIEYP